MKRRVSLCPSGLFLPGGGVFPGPAVLRDGGAALLLPRAVPGADRREPRAHGPGEQMLVDLEGGSCSCRCFNAAVVCIVWRPKRFGPRHELSLHRQKLATPPPDAPLLLTVSVFFFMDTSLGHARAHRSSLYLASASNGGPVHSTPVPPGECFTASSSTSSFKNRIASAHVQTLGPKSRSPHPLIPCSSLPGGFSTLNSVQIFRVSNPKILARLLFRADSIRFTFDSRPFFVLHGRSSSEC